MISCQVECARRRGPDPGQLSTQQHGHTRKEQKWIISRCPTWSGLCDTPAMHRLSPLRISAPRRLCAHPCAQYAWARLTLPDHVRGNRCSGRSAHNVPISRGNRHRSARQKAGSPPVHGVNFVNFHIGPIIRPVAAAHTHRPPAHPSARLHFCNHVGVTLCYLNVLLDQYSHCPRRT
jgi:hypothetical protein